MIQQKTGRYTMGSGALAVGFLLMATVMVVLLAHRSAHAATTFTVSYAGDEEDHNPGDGVCDTLPHPQLIACTLRAAIEEANETDSFDTIDFHIGGSGVKTIKPNSELPSITDRVIINGYTQLGASPNSLAQGTNAVLRIELDGDNAGNLADGLTIEASNSVVKGLVVNRFDGTGIEIGTPGVASDPEGNTIRGNFIGTDTSGTLDRGNIDGGVLIRFEGTSGNTVGGTTPAARNLVSGNTGGISVVSSAANNGIKGNLIGTEKDGTGELGNSSNGVTFAFDSFDNTVGGATAGSANTIAYNGEDGVAVVDAFSTGNRVLRNSIYSNDGLGLDLIGGIESASGSTSNDFDDLDGGPNNLQNKPDLISAENSGGETTVNGDLSSTSNETFKIRFFSNPSGNEGKKYIGQKSIATDANGNDSFTFQPAKKVAVGQTITATATSDSTGDTSEFSGPEEVS
jgi:CSLREA domain-containing protein